MRKLSLDKLKVDSFATADVPEPRGTVQAHQSGAPGCGGGPSGEPGCGGDSFDICTYDIQACGDTQYIDCSMGCTIHITCPFC